MTDVHVAGEFYSAFPERRINPFKPEVRNAIPGSAPAHITGYASVFNKLSRKLGGFVEKVDNRAFTTSKAEGWQDVVCRYNHNDDFLLGTTRAGTCLIDFDSTGLLYDVVPPSFRQDIIELCERGDCQHSSFAFRVPEGGDDWSLSDFNYPQRTLLSVDLVDVAPVITPAYPDATAAARAMDGAVQSLSQRFQAEPTEIRSLLAENMGVKLFKRSDRMIVPTVVTTTGTNTYSTGATTTTLEFTTTTPQEGEMSLDEQRTALYEAEVRAKYDAAAMKKMASSGEAMANAKGDPSYPIADEEDLHNAIHAVGRGHASHEAIRQHIIARAKTLGLSHMLPADWAGNDADDTPAAPDSSDEKNSVEEVSEERAAKASVHDLETCGKCGATDQYGKHCVNCGNSMEPPMPDPHGNGKFCANCGSKMPTAAAKRSEHECGTETPEEETEAPAEERTETPEETEVTEEVTNGHVIGSSEDQLAKLGLQRRQRILELQEKRFDPFLDDAE